jgi:myo-inositol-1(or 4)-monophosphatase
VIDADRLEAIVREAGRIAHDMWPGAGHALEAWEKSPGNPVCAADMAVDAFLKRELGALLPAAGWLSEETVDDPERLARDLIWLVDPIDGTRDFIRGRTGWAVSVALISSGRPLIGSLAAPARGEFWHAIAGQGSWRNGKPLVASQRREFAGARVPTDALPKEDRDLAIVAKPNSIALRAAMVAADEADLLHAALGPGMGHRRRRANRARGGRGDHRRLRPPARLQQARSARVRAADQCAGHPRRGGGAAGGPGAGNCGVTSNCGVTRRAGPLSETGPSCDRNDAADQFRAASISAWVSGTILISTRRFIGSLTLSPVATLRLVSPKPSQRIRAELTPRPIR